MGGGSKAQGREVAGRGLLRPWEMSTPLSLRPLRKRYYRTGQAIVRGEGD